MKNEALERKKKAVYYFLIISSFLLYVILTGAKNLYVSEKTTLAEVFSHLENPLTAIAATMEYYFYSYAAMQVILIFLMKKINIKWYLTITIAASAILTTLVGFTDSIEHHYIIYVINGIFQAGLWGCSMKILSLYLPSKFLATASAFMTSGPAMATLVAYGTAVIFSDDWKTPFLLLGILTFVTVLVYFLSVSLVQRYPREPETHSVVLDDGSELKVDNEDENDFIHLDSRCRLIVFYAISILISFLATSLFFMVNNNLDIFLKEVASFSNDKAKLFTVFAPVSIIVGPMMSIRICEKYKNFITVSAFFFLGATLFALLALLFFRASAMLSLVLLIIFLVLANGARAVTLTVAGTKLRSKIDTGVYSTALNVVASIAAGIAPKFIAIFIDNNAYTTMDSWGVALGFILGWSIVTLCVMVGANLIIKIANRTHS